MSRHTLDDVNAIRGLILAQLAAFAEGDAEGAFALLSPSLRARFGTAEVFLATVRDHCREAVTARRVQFGVGRPGRHSGYFQSVLLIDAEGRRCLAWCHYRQDEHLWRVTGWVSPGWLQDGAQAIGPPRPDPIVEG